MTTLSFSYQTHSLLTVLDILLAKAHSEPCTTTHLQSGCGGGDDDDNDINVRQSKINESVTSDFECMNEFALHDLCIYTPYQIN